MSEQDKEINRLRVAEAEAMALVLQHESVINRLRAELDTVKKERDEARTEAEAFRRHAQEVADGNAPFQPFSLPWEYEG